MRYLKRRWSFAALLGVLAYAVTLAPATASADHARAGDVVGHVYVNDNSAGTNTIAAFDRHADGTLTPERRSPFSAGGAGLGKAVGSQGALQVTQDGRYLLAVDAGSNQVSVLRIRRDGSLELVHGGVVYSGGVEPVSIAIHDDLVYVANAGAGGADYTGFRLSRSGHLRPIRGSTVSLPDTADPGDVLFNATGTNLVGTEVGTSVIDSFHVNWDGTLTAASGSPFGAQGLGPFGSEFSPTNAGQLFVSNAHNTAPDSGTVSAFSVADDGTLTSIGTSPFADNQMAPCWVEISHDGKYLFAVNTASASISSYSIAGDGALGLLGSTSFKAGKGSGAQDARLSPDGGTLWVVDTAARAISGFTVSGGSVTEGASSPTTTLPPDSFPFGIVVN